MKKTPQGNDAWTDISWKEADEKVRDSKRSDTTFRALAEAKIVRAEAEKTLARSQAKLKLAQQKEGYLKAQLEYELASEEQ